MLGTVNPARCATLHRTIGDDQAASALDAREQAGGDVVTDCDELGPFYNAIVIFMKHLFLHMEPHVDDFFVVLGCLGNGKLDHHPTFQLPHRVTTLFDPT
jgi:hypothetical protein